MSDFMHGFHYFYSEQQSEDFAKYSNVVRNYAIIDGKECLYTICSRNKDYKPAFKDVKYLGQGKFARTDGCWGDE